jgi:uncharacterized protein YdhG (YjbR/CyaY superfamily)
MQTSRKQFKTIDEYIAAFPKDVRTKLNSVRRTIKATAPEAEETISYQIPTFKLHGYLVYFAAWKNHIAMYPIPSGTPAFKREISRFVAGKGTVQFPLDKPLPLALIRRIVKHRMKESLERKQYGK